MMGTKHTSRPLTLTQAQRQYINTVKPLAVGCCKSTSVGARLQLSKWAKNHGYDPVVVLNDALDVLELELASEA